MSESSTLVQGNSQKVVNKTSYIPYFAGRVEGGQHPAAPDQDGPGGTQAHTRLLREEGPAINDVYIWEHAGLC